MSALVGLARALTPSQAMAVAASLEIDGRLDYALSALPDGSSRAAELLQEARAVLGNAVLLAAMLRGFAAAASKAPDPPRAVWSGPTFDGDSDHTTAAVAHLLDTAVEDVFASTYSASSDSPFVQALWRAVARGVSVTVLVEAERMEKTVASLRLLLTGARFLAYKAPLGEYGIQHSKVVIVDSSLAFVTSANLSEAAAERNLEAGVLIRDPSFASNMRQRFLSLERSGQIYVL